MSDADVASLRSVPLFADVGDDHLARIAEVATAVRGPGGSRPRRTGSARLRDVRDPRGHASRWTFRGSNR